MEVQAMQRLISSILATSVLTVVIGGCHQGGPASVKIGRADYNIAIQQTNSEQLLLNLVRLR